MARLNPDQVVDCTGLVYPAPILRAEQTLNMMAAGQVLEIITTDANVRPDLAQWAEHVRAEVLEVTADVEGRYSFFVRRRPGGSPLARSETRSGPDSRLFLVVLTSGFDYSPIVRSAFMYASLAAAMGFETVVYCVQAGADTMVRSRIQESDRSRAGEPTILGRYNEAREMGVRVEVCEQTANVRGIRAEDLVDGAVLKGGAVLIDYAARASGQLTF